MRYQDNELDTFRGQIEVARRSVLDAYAKLQLAIASMHELDGEMAIIQDTAFKIRGETEAPQPESSEVPFA